MKYTPHIALFITTLLIGCTTKSGGGKGPEISNAAELSPGAMVPTSANLKIGDIDIPVEVQQTVNGSEVRLDLAAHGQVFETEGYLMSDKSFDLVDAAGEHYKPNLPLLKFPMRVGDTWNWSGEMTAGEKPHNATATITSTSDSILVPGLGTTETVLVVVDLSIESGGPTAANRKLRFWFAKGKGPIKRQFGVASSREPGD